MSLQGKGTIHQGKWRVSIEKFLTFLFKNSVKGHSTAHSGRNFYGDRLNLTSLTEFDSLLAGVRDGTLASYQERFS